ncbi:hypothetical protein I553_5403 [Mycobacterium xenopi 4042]|uniref:Uncharacterized protein n=1 Tax=Mycobacterium xenopi 4042 TaxID=1299334 RepID=X7ZYV2_MYCXE|nr:hypothetical protein I553_5403 [Mycobacterium xenopi 4042]
MTVTVGSTTPTAVIDRVSLVLDAFDGGGRLTLAQIVRRTACRARRHTGCSSGWCNCAGCAAAVVTTSWAYG